MMNPTLRFQNNKCFFQMLNRCCPIDLSAYIPLECNREHFPVYLEKYKLEKKEYQLKGGEWLIERECGDNPHGGVRGGLLADEMGLGKTIQLIGCMVSNPLPCTLVVLPVALIDQWQQQFLKYSPYKPVIYHAEKKKRYSLEDLRGASVIITSYGHICESEGKTNVFHQLSFDRVVFDEAHHMRNPLTKKFKGAKLIKARVRWLLTGTPIQNSLSDFASLCTLMGYPKNICANKESMNEVIRCSVLKRTKYSVGLSLVPPKLHHVVVPWGSDEEKWLAEDIHRTFTILKENFGERQSHSISGELTSSAFAMLVRARQACISASLMGDLVRQFIREGYIDDSDYDIAEAMKHHSKIDAVCHKLIERKGNARRKLVFCHYSGEIDLIRKQLTAAGMVVGVFDGRTPKKGRDELLKNMELEVLILQIATGSEGLNLQHYTETYFVSAHWNPALEDQAVARCHRIGQLEDVEVFRFEMAPFGKSCNIEQYCKTVQDDKRKLYAVLDLE